MHHYSPTRTLHRAATLGEMLSGSNTLIFSGSIFRTCSLCLPVRAVKSKLPGIGFPVGSRFCHIWKLTPLDRMVHSSCRRLLMSSPRYSRLAWYLLSAYRMRFLSRTSTCSIRCSSSTTMWSSLILSNGGECSPDVCCNDMWGVGCQTSVSRGIVLSPDSIPPHPWTCSTFQQHDRCSFFSLHTMTSDVYTCHLPRSCTIDRHMWNVPHSAP